MVLGGVFGALLFMFFFVSLFSLPFNRAVTHLFIYISSVYNQSLCNTFLTYPSHSLRYSSGTCNKNPSRHPAHLLFSRPNFELPRRTLLTTSLAPERNFH